MAITLNTVSNTGHGTLLVCAYSADATGNEELVAAVTGKSHFIKKIRVDCCPGTTAKWIQINSTAAALIGPVDLTDYNSTFEYEFIEPLKVPVGTAINIDEESATPISVILEYKTEP